MSVAALGKTEPMIRPGTIRSVHRFTVEQYERMTELGILKGNDRVELLEGWIVEKMTQYPPHAVAVDLARDAVETLLTAGWRVREQKPIRLRDSEPEPDLAIVKGPVSRYRQRHPVPSDIALVIEVADSSLAEDRSWKGRLYAGALLPIYWIINLVDSQVEVYSQPKGGRLPVYRDRQEYGKKDEVPLLIAGHERGRIAVRELLP